MSKRLLDHDPYTGITQWFHWDDVNQTTYIESVQDTTSILDLNNKLYNNDDYKRHGYKEGWVHVGQIPMVLIEEFKNKGIDLMAQENWTLVKKLMNDSDYSKLRTSSGRV